MTSDQHPPNASPALTADAGLAAAFDSVRGEALAFFAAAAPLCNEPESTPFGSAIPDPEHYWRQLTAELRERAQSLETRLLTACASIAEAVRLSLLTGAADLRDVQIATKKLRAALRLRSYYFHEADVLHDEGTVLGVRPASQSELIGLSPADAERAFSAAANSIGAVVRLVEAQQRRLDQPRGQLASAYKYRANTAFVMMWMDPQKAELSDIADTVRSVFQAFGIKAVRADDIEHEGLITERVLNEIRTSEFLFADLTGARPNVYYEVGFAHALGKRVILFRQTGTGLHFDLAGYNCPEYKNLRDLREALTKRLVALTNQNPSLEK